MVIRPENPTGHFHLWTYGQFSEEAGPPDKTASDFISLGGRPKLLSFTDYNDDKHKKIEYIHSLIHASCTTKTDVSRISSASTRTPSISSSRDFESNSRNKRDIIINRTI